MRVIVTNVNPKLSRAIIEMGDLDFGWIEVLGDYDLEEEDILEGKFDLGEETVYDQTQKIEMDIFVEDYGCSLDIALKAIHRTK